MNSDLLLTKCGVEGTVDVDSADQVGQLGQVARQLLGSVRLANAGEVDERSVFVKLHGCLTA